MLPFDRIAAIMRQCSWAGDVSNFPREVTVTALAHVIGDKAEQAYRRSDALEKRRKLMDAWGDYWAKPSGVGRAVGPAGTVIPIGRVS